MKLEVAGGIAAHKRYTIYEMESRPLLGRHMKSRLPGLEGDIEGVGW